MPCAGGQGPTIRRMASWFDRHFVDSGRLPLFVCFAAFVVTFITTRVITRMIRADRGPFNDNVTASGTHIHHSVPGIVLLITGAYIGVAAQSATGWSIAAALLVGVGSSLVLDEFALILHLQDVYWSNEGRISVEMVSLAVGALGLVLVGLDPFSVDETVAGSQVLATVIILAVNLPAIVVCVDKGKFKLALFGAFIPFVAIVGSVRLARPDSRWARRRYGATRRAASQHRARGATTPASVRRPTGSSTSWPGARRSPIRRHRHPLRRPNPITRARPTSAPSPGRGPHQYSRHEALHHARLRR